MDRGHPIVHFDVDVRRVGAVPVREILMVPNPLQIRRLGVRPGRGDKQIPAEIEHCLRQHLQTMRFFVLIRAKDRRERVLRQRVQPGLRASCHSQIIPRAKPGHVAHI